MEFHANPSRFSLRIAFVVGDLVERVKEMCSAAVSVVLGNIFSAILTFFFALGMFSNSFSCGQTLGWLSVLDL